MAGTTPNLGLYLPGGGSTGAYTPDEVADIDPLNQNFVKIDAFVGGPTTQNRQFLGPNTGVGAVTGMKVGDRYQENNAGFRTLVYDGTQWVATLTSAEGTGGDYSVGQQVCVASINVIAGRLYRISANIFGTVITAGTATVAASVKMAVSPGNAASGTDYIWPLPPVAGVSNQLQGGYASKVWTATMTGGIVFAIVASASGGSAYRVAAGEAQLLLEPC